MKINKNEMNEILNRISCDDEDCDNCILVDQCLEFNIEPSCIDILSNRIWEDIKILSINKINKKGMSKILEDISCLGNNCGECDYLYDRHHCFALDLKEIQVFVNEIWKEAKILNLEKQANKA